MPSPTMEEWSGIARDFYEKWNFPNCIGAIDGKHINIQAPPGSGSMYYNYKGFHSVVLMAVVDANYKFVLVDIGAYGRNSDGGVLAHSAFGKALSEGRLGIPQDVPLPYTTHPNVPFVIVGDEAFPLKTNMMRPYPGKKLNEAQRIFNYRLSRARRISENAFGILASRWRLFRRVIIAHPSKVEMYVKACCVLHNFLMSKASADYCPTLFVDREQPDGTVEWGEWREADQPSSSFSTVKRVGTNFSSQEAVAVRNAFTSYFGNPVGQVPWQFAMVRSGLI
jgi:hypothetical protein